MTQEMFSQCKECGNGFFYTRVGLHSRIRVYCDKCKRAHVRAANNARQRRFRDRKREAENPTNKQPGDNPPRLARDGSRDAVSRASVAPSTRGMFATLPDPGRTAKRKAMGLP